MREIEKRLFSVDPNFTVQNIFAAPSGVSTAFCPVFHFKTITAFVLIRDQLPGGTVAGMVQDAQHNAETLSEAFPKVPILQLDSTGKTVTQIATEYVELIKFGQIGKF